MTASLEQVYLTYMGEEGRPKKVTTTAAAAAGDSRSAAKGGAK